MAGDVVHAAQAGVTGSMSLKIDAGQGMPRQVHHSPCELSAVAAL